LAYDTVPEGQSGEITVRQYQDSNWDSTILLEDTGYAPVLYLDKKGEIHAAWCGDDDLIRYQSLSNALSATEQIDFPKCSERPALSKDGYGRIHLLWRADEVANNQDVISKGNFLYESIRLDGGWSEPALIVQPGESGPPVVVTDDVNDLQIAWIDASAGIQHATQPFYTCDESTGSYLGDAILAVATSGLYRPADEAVPFCQNQFVEFLHLPKSDPAFSDQESTIFGGFDNVADQIRDTDFEVLFATMEWMKDENQDSPGMLFARAVTDLYEKVKSNPQHYPKGVTVRVLLGNYPEIATFTWGEQVWNVMDVLQKAGLPEMENAELGWKVELANYDGQIPHSHTKFVVVDGEVVTASGFNYSYLHLPETHPSGQGVSLVDLGLEMQGPVAQQALAEYDDLWDGSDLVLCPNLNPPDGNWANHCDFGVAEATHVPEALLYHPTSRDNFAFSLLRTSTRPEGDDAIEAVIRSAQETIDIFEVSFSLKLYCTLGVVMEGFCSMDDALQFTHALADVMEENGVKIRVLVTDVNMNGMENKVAIDVMQDELARRGISDQAELRYYVGRMHPKALLADDKLLIVGSQNFHYSAWGDDAGLAEYSLATDDPEAIAEFQRTFEYFWEQGIPVDQVDGAGNES
jgi:phosphatidylserine/phosphatidylglycerophosphate/cardiolipin synthase-like enzyme